MRAALAHEPVGLIVLDVILPDVDGVDFLKEIRSSRFAEIPVLLLSTEAEVKDRIRGLQMGADEYVGKPYDAAYVVGRARELLQIRAPAVIGKPAVLVIDDSATLREVLRQGLESSGYVALLASTGEEGLRLAASERPAAIILDGMLPGIDGATVIRRIRLDAALRATPCMLLTSSDERGAELRALEAGADVFAHKEDDLEVILVRLATMLRNAAVAPDRSLTSSSLGPKKIMAVDDSPTYLNELVEILMGDGYDVVTARSGREALDMLAVQSVDCILLDRLMPDLDGEETCRQIKTSTLFRDIPLIMLTAVEDRSSMIQGLGAGADDYISKSSEFEVLKARVRAQLRRKQSEDEYRKVREELLQAEIEAAEARSARKIAEVRALLIDELERKNKELEALSYSVSHDLRAPLRAIDGFSQVLLDRYMHILDEKGQGYLGRVRTAAQRMGELIDDLLSLSKISRAELTRRSVNISELAQHVADELSSRDSSRQVSFVIQENLVVNADKRLMQVVFENLLGNAWKFTAKKSQALIEFGAEPSGDGKTYFVRDNGAGFNMAYVEKLFHPFQRLHTELDFPGTGIGLATVHRIIDRHGGRISAKSEPGAGATFVFTIPSARTGELE